MQQTFQTHLCIHKFIDSQLKASLQNELWDAAIEILQRLLHAYVLVRTANKLCAQTLQMQ